MQLEGKGEEQWAAQNEAAPLSSRKEHTTIFTEHHRTIKVGKDL